MRKIFAICGFLVTMAVGASALYNAPIQKANAADGDNLEIVGDWTRLIQGNQTLTETSKGIELKGDGGFGTRTYLNYPLDIASTEFDFEVRNASNFSGYHFYFTEEANKHYSQIVNGQSIAVFNVFIGTFGGDLTQTRCGVRTNHDIFHRIEGASAKTILNRSNPDEASNIGFSSAYDLIANTGAAPANTIKMHFKFESASNDYYKITITEGYPSYFWHEFNYNYKADSQNRSTVTTYIAKSKFSPSTNGTGFLTIGTVPYDASKTNPNQTIAVTNLADKTIRAEAEGFANSILNDIDCDSTGARKPICDWNALKVKYNALSSTTKKYINPDHGAIFYKALEKYDYIIEKYGEGNYENFLRRKINLTSNNLVLNFDSTNTFIYSLIVISSILSITGFGLLTRRSVSKHLFDKKD